MKIHFVKAGETLYEISKKYGVTVEAIVAANTSITDPNTIMAGMKLIIPVKQQVHFPVDNVGATSHVQSLLNLNPPQIPVYPEQVPPQSAPQQTPQTTQQTMPQLSPQIKQQTMPQLTPQSTVQTMPQAPTGIQNQGFSYPGQAVPPFAAVPIPAQPVSQPTYTPMPASVTMPSPTAWTMPTGYPAYNTPYHMTNYSIPHSVTNAPNPSLNAVNLGMPLAATNYQPYSTSMVQYPNHANYEYYNTYSALQNNAEWPSYNPQPHGQYNQPQFTQDIVQPEQNKLEMEQSTGQQEKKKVRSSSTTKERVAVKSKKNTLHDQVLKLHQTRNKSNQR